MLCILFHCMTTYRLFHNQPSSLMAGAATGIHLLSPMLVSVSCNEPGGFQPNNSLGRKAGPGTRLLLGGSVSPSPVVGHRQHPRDPQPHRWGGSRVPRHPPALPSCSGWQEEDPRGDNQGGGRQPSAREPGVCGLCHVWRRPSDKRG